MARVKHKQVYRPNAFGGVTNTTLCGRVRQGNEMNMADSDEQVTCKFCLRRMEIHRATQGKTVKVEFNGRYGYLSECTVEICESDSKAEAKAAA